MTFHVVLAWNGSNRVQLEKAYLPVLFLKQKPRSNTAEGAGRYQKVLVLMYEQAKPSRQWAMLLEDLPQGMVALVVSSVEGFQAFTVIVNIGVPLFRISMAWLLHDWIASQLADWFLEEAMKASDAKQFALCDDFVAALHRLQNTSSFKASDFTLWEHLRKKNEKCCLEAFQKAQDEQSPVSLRLFVALQRVGRGNESSSAGWAKINELLKQCTLKQICDATSSIVCASRSSELLLPPGLGFTKVMTILASIRQLTKLEVHLGDEKIGFSGAKVLGQALPKFQHLTTLTLYLYSNNLGPEGGKVLGEQLGKLQQITTLELWLDNNNLGPEGGKALGESLGKLQKITSLWLYLRDNNLGSEGGKDLGQALGKLQEITTLTLWLDNNQLGSEGGKALGEQLSKLQQITSLKLSLLDNNLGPEGGKVLGESLSKLQEITSLKLSLGYNNLGPEAASALADHLSDLVHLTSVELDLQYNGIADVVGAEIERRLERPGRRVVVVA